MKLKYVKDNERSIKTFIIREEDEAHLLKSRGKLLDWLKKLSGETIVEVMLETNTMLIAVAFENEVVMSTWQVLVDPVVLNEVKTCKILLLQEKTPEAAAKSSERIQASIRNNGGKVLKIKSVTLTAYRLMVYFSKEEDMHKWEKTYSLT